MIHDSFAVSQGGITWCITPLLSLGADQEHKINNTANQDNGAIISIHLDEYMDPNKQQSLSNTLCTLQNKTTITVVILSSLQCLVNSKI